MHQLIDKKKKILVYLLFLLILSTTSGKFIESKKSYSSKINKINVEGLSSAENKKISNELNYLFYKSILLAGKDEIQKVISKYNTIEEYSIKKTYPSRIDINIQPTKYVARLSNNDQLVGKNGKLIDNKAIDEILPYIFGEFNSKEFLLFINNVEQSKFILSEFKTLYFFPSKRWDILTINGVLIKLPQDDFSESLNLAHRIINDNNFIDKKLIDLRMNNHLILK